MDLFSYKNIGEGINSVEELLLSYLDSPNHRIIHARLKHICDNGFFCVYVKYCRGGKCYDGRKVRELKIPIASEKKLIRIFFVDFDNNILLCDWLKKRNNPDWNKKEKNAVDKDYTEKINNSKLYYKKAREDDKYLNPINL